MQKTLFSKILWLNKHESFCIKSMEKFQLRIKAAVCNFWYSYGNKVSIFQENSKNTQIQVNILPFS